MQGIVVLEHLLDLGAERAQHVTHPLGPLLGRDLAGRVDHVVDGSFQVIAEAVPGGAELVGGGHDGILPRVACTRSNRCGPPLALSG
ncbi:MAG: hypothetical protein GWN79_15030 [Actinobacteria bacterium]|nr:hypothetical protein [Actinomycetota bacterium]NIS33070.1 hypothetical protein [Actinomycetota bacterium]NIT94171.1 hypothetical protein [Actinomycetota bacterium]NIU20310.1 hypothetical protein [Actinomycetota bacterium]NIU67996.1 hypothetical protein [Actinomycetota bacterium]